MAKSTVTPVIFLAFANTAEKDFLQHLKEESAGLRDLLLPLDQAGRIDLLREESTDIQDIAGLLTQYKDRVAVFHYGGHADGQQLILEDTPGQAQGLAGLLALQSSLRLVFLNGCATRAQAQAYAQSTGAAVVATTRSIPDAEATRFALAFYAALTQRHTLQEAFRAATGTLQFSNSAYRRLSPEATLIQRGFHLEAVPKEEKPAWDFFVREDQRHVLDWTLPAAAPQLNEKLVVVLANSEAYQEMETRIAGLQQKIADKQRQLEAFPTPLPEALQPVKDSLYQEWLSLSGEREKAEATQEAFRQEVLRLAETFNRVDLHSESLQQAKALFEAGRFPEADAVLKESEIQDRQEQLLEIKNRLTRELSQIDQQLRNNADEFLIKAQLSAARQGQTPDWETATAAHFEQSLQSLLYFDNLLIYSNFLYDHNQYSAAGARYRQLLQLPLSLPERAVALNNLGELYRESGAFADARPCFDEALSLYRRLAEANVAFRAPLARTLNNNGLLHKTLMQFPEAHRYLEEALALQRQQVEEDPDGARTDVARTLNNLGELHRKTQDFAGAQAYFEEALTLYRDLTRQDAPAHEPMLARCLNNQGLLFAESGHYDQARAAYEEALDIGRRLARNDPRAYMPDVAKMLNNLGELFRETLRFSDARAHYGEALGISRQLAAQDTTAFLGDVARTLNNLGLLEFAQKRFGEAQSLLGEALQCYEQLEAAEPTAYWLDKIRVRNNLGELFRESGRPDEAAVCFQQAIDDIRPLTAQAPATLPLLAKVLANLGTARTDQGNLPEALPSFEEAEAIYRKLGAGQQESLLSDFAMTLSNLGSLDLIMGRTEEAQRRLEEALTLQTPLAEANPQAFLPTYTFTLICLSAFYRTGKPDREKSVDYANRAIARARPFAGQAPVAQEYLTLAGQLAAAWE